MKARTVLLLLCILSFAGSLTGGYFYFSTLKDVTVSRAHKDAEKSLQLVVDRMKIHITVHKKEVTALASIQSIQGALRSGDQTAVQEANAALRNFQTALGADVCYLMNRKGLTVAASNHDSPTSFIGKNYAFRPYFREAMLGEPSLYFALGITSKKRGAYFSAPVYVNGDRTPAGVVVMKVSAEHLEGWLEKLSEGHVVLIDPNGVIFASNHQDWLYKLLWEAPPEKLRQIAATRQFGPGPWEWTGVRRIDDHHAVDSSDKKYMIHPLTLEMVPGWQLIYLHDLKKVTGKVYNKIFRIASYFVLVLCLLIIVSIFALYKRAHSEILRRKNLEEKLRQISITDDLTGLLNRRGFFTLAEQQLKVAERMQEELFLLYADLDNLKQINDNLGHDIGDQALRETADVLRNTFRESDIIGRLGGDEFSVLFTSAENSIKAEKTVMARLEQHLAAYNRQNRRNYELHLSIGIVAFDKALHSSIDNLLTEADTLMYQHKKSKKDAFRAEQRTSPAS